MHGIVGGMLWRGANCSGVLSSCPSEAIANGVEWRLVRISQEYYNPNQVYSGGSHAAFCGAVSLIKAHRIAAPYKIGKKDLFSQKMLLGRSFVLIL